MKKFNVNMFKLFHKNDKEYLIERQPMYKTRCMFCRNKIKRDEGNTLFWNDYVHCFNEYGIVLNTQARYCNSCRTTMNWFLKV